MLQGNHSRLYEVLKEPPLRLLPKSLLRYFPVSIRSKADWDSCNRVNYLFGLIAGADEARRVKAPSICAIEFGVAAGDGLVAMENLAEAVERETGIQIHAVGFDAGTGLPPVPNDYRNHPDQWRTGQYPMDVERLRRRLRRAELILGDVEQTVPQFLERQPAPLGFVSFDLDFHHSTKNAMRILSDPNRKLLRRVPLYFDDTRGFWCHRFAGELLAIEEFNAENPNLKIDHWQGIEDDRAFPEKQWLKQMYLLHDFSALTGKSFAREK